jgi:hypothetical protein
LSRFVLSLFVCVYPGLIFAHDPVTTKITWTQEISRIVQNRCLRCHGASAKIPLSTYAESRPWAKAIRDQVLTRRMPPWGAVHGAGDFRGDPSLTEPEIERIVQWVEGGAPEGDPIYLPSPRPQPAVAAPHFGPALKVLHGHPLTLDTARTFAAIRPDSPLEAIAMLPGGRIQHLIWLADFHALTYTFRERLTLPKGTVVRVTHGSAALFDVPPAPSVALH